MSSANQHTSVEEGKPKGSSMGQIACFMGSYGLVIAVLVLYGLLIAVLAFAGRGAVTAINPGWGQPLYCEDGIQQTPANVAEYEWWPGCDRKVKSAEDFDACGGDCFDHELPFAMQNFNKQHNFTLVNGIPSRKADGVEDARLTAWWLPADDDSPVVVLVHGMSSTFNAMKVQVPAYYLRSMGLSVLVPNLRSHGSSSNSSHGSISWGLEYPYDVLGAWDYVVADPEGVLGGKRDPSKVGMAGGSLGGMAAAAAFGMEEKIPGLWLNGAIFDPKVDLYGKQVAFLGPLAPAIYEPAWLLMEASTGLSLRDLIPEKVMVDAPGAHHDLLIAAALMLDAPKSGRPVALIKSPQDGATPQSAVDGYKSLIENSDGRYELKVEWYPEGLCNGDIHVFESIKWPKEYQKKSCEFWSPILLNKACDKDEITS